MDRVVVVGGSIAGFSAALELRRQGFEGSLRIVADEPHRTYQRPPLSKEVLAGGDEDKVPWAAAADDGHDIDWLLGERAVGLDLSARTVGLASGEQLDFDGLVIASGAAPRRLPGTEGLAGVHVMRTLDDSLGLRSDLDASPSRVVVIGAGFIGAEVAATCRTRGHEVTLVEPMPQPMAKALGDELGAAMADVHRAHGVDVRLGVGVDGLEGTDRVEGVRLSDGTLVAADVVVVGIGVVPSTGWLEGSGIPLGDGVEADAALRVAPGVVACGDVASWDSARYGRIRVEHWDNAADMGRHAAQSLLAGEDATPYDSLPWFWSDQYDVRLQMAGRATPPEAGGRFQILEGSIEENRFIGVFGRDGVVTAALGWNWPARTVKLRMRMQAEELAWDEVVGA